MNNAPRRVVLSPSFVAKGSIKRRVPIIIIIKKPIAMIVERAGRLFFIFCLIFSILVCYNNAVIGGGTVKFFKITLEVFYNDRCNLIFNLFLNKAFKRTCTEFFIKSVL